MKRILSPGFTVILLVWPSMAVRADKVDDYLKAEMQKRHVPGLSLAVVKNGKIVKMTGFGQANLESNAPVTEDTVFEIASLTKPFTATAIMILVEDGKIGLDDEIGRHLPEVPRGWSGVTVRHLLAHTSGLPSYLSHPGFAKLNRKLSGPSEILQLVSGSPLQFQPGEKVDYCNTNYILLGLMTHRVTGKSYSSFLAEKMFYPLGMKNTRLNDRTEIILNRASGYVFENDTLRNVVHTNLNNAYSTAGLLSTARDLATWVLALQEGKMLKASSLKQMWTPARLNDGSQSTMGLGWGIGLTRGRRGVGHSGDILGFSTSITLWPATVAHAPGRSPPGPERADDQIAVIVLTNRSGSEAGTLGLEGLIRLLPPGRESSKK